MAPLSALERVRRVDGRALCPGGAWRGRLAVALLGLAVTMCAGAATPGERLYLDGVTLAGSPLVGERQQGGVLSGSDAACGSCHRRSGLGTFEGAIRVPPVAWSVLSRSAEQIASDRALPHVLGFHPHRPAYTRATLLRALREGIGADGQTLSWVMPRYPGLGDADFDALYAHLTTLLAVPPAGASDGQLLFALVVTPQADARVVAAVTALYERAFADHNAQIGHAVGAVRADAGALDIQRLLHLVVWRLQGAAASWPAQLQHWRSQQPPFALLGGMGGGDWATIDRWCEAQHLPLILPGVDAPDPHDGFYAIHFHRGVTLEAALIAQDLQTRYPHPVPLVQVYREGDSGVQAAAALRAALGADWPIREIALPASAAILPAVAGTAAASPAPAAPAPVPDPASACASGAPDGSVAALWLRPADLAALGPARACERLYVSGIMAGESTRLPAAWVGRALTTYPWELPARRRIAMNLPLGWLRAKGQPLVDERAQTDAWLASQVLDVALADLIDAYYPDYLVERVESLLGHRLGNGHYPRLTLAPGQRFASKGAYLLRLQDDGRLAPEGGWRIP